MAAMLWRIAVQIAVTLLPDITATYQIAAIVALEWIVAG